MANQRKNHRRSARGRRRPIQQFETGVLNRLLIMLAVVAAIVLGVAIFFRVNSVEVQGNRIYSADQIAQVSGLELGDNLLMVNKAAVAGRVKVEMPYVQDVSVGRILPDTIVIRVHESEIVALVKAESGAGWYLNTEGRILGSSLTDFDGQTIEVTGVSIAAPEVGMQALASEGQSTELAAALEILHEMEGTGLIGQITSIDVEAAYDIHMWCGEQYEVLLGGTEEIPYKIQYLQAVLEQLDTFQMGTIDLTFDVDRVASFRPRLQE